MTAILFSFISVFLISSVMLLTVFSPQKKVSRRLSKLNVYDDIFAENGETDTSFYERIVIPILNAVSIFIRRVSPKGFTENISKRLVLAGNPRGMDADRFFSFKLLFTFLTLIIVFIFLSIPGPSIGRVLLVGGLAVLLAFFIPDLWLSNRIEKRQKKIRLALPDTLDLLSVSVDAGLAFDAALSKIIKQGIGPLGEEFARMLQAMQVGSSRKNALKELSARTNVKDFQSFILSIIQADVFGVGISKVLKTQAYEMRNKRRQYAEERAQKTPVKIVFPVVLCIFPALMVVIIGPAIIRAIEAFSMM